MLVTEPIMSGLAPVQSHLLYAGELPSNNGKLGTHEAW